MAIAGEAMSRAHSVPRLRYANFESRFVAAVLDGLILCIIAAIDVAIAGMVLLVSSDFGELDPPDSAYYTFIGILIAIAPLWAVYFLASWAWRGQTIGQAIMQITVTRESGDPLGLAGSLARVVALSVYPLVLAAGVFLAYTQRHEPLLVAAIIAASLLLVLAGLLSAVFDAQRRAVHDRIAGTIVVRVL
jgi:uncharacterized RDD family membrane protein YckC